MSQNSIPNATEIGGFIGGPVGALLGQPASNLFNPPAAPNLNTPASATTGTPTLADTNTTAIQNQLSQEKQMASTSSILTGGAGLLDEPTTTSRILVGA